MNNPDTVTLEYSGILPTSGYPESGPKLIKQLLHDMSLCIEDLKTSIDEGKLIVDDYDEIVINTFMYRNKTRIFIRLGGSTDGA